MPLTNNIIIKLNEISVIVEDKTRISNAESDQIKKIFQTLLQQGEIYDVDEIESWLENEGSWPNKETRIRITNISHYMQDKYQQNSRFKIISENDSCSCSD